ncbi:MAG: hypothetical protein HYY24_13180 [Verrucomicrobia bacterium]|nr:hypothetical protein [Verrucomicrobiota bacterium]
MKAKEKKAETEVPFDPILFAATVPARKPTPKDLADAKEQPDDAIEPKDHESMDQMVEDL